MLLSGIASVQASLALYLLFIDLDGFSLGPPLGEFYGYEALDCPLCWRRVGSKDSGRVWWPGGWPNGAWGASGEWSSDHRQDTGSHPCQDLQQGSAQPHPARFPSVNKSTTRQPLTRLAPAFLDTYLLLVLYSPFNIFLWISCVCVFFLQYGISELYHHSFLLLSYLFLSF